MLKYEYLFSLHYMTKGSLINQLFFQFQDFKNHFPQDINKHYSTNNNVFVHIVLIWGDVGNSPDCAFELVES